jgi:exodeoxyribonuclease V gamma subunit
MRVFTSNRLECLAEKLAEVLRTPLSSPFDEDIVVIQSRGMERWISMELARHNGICANCRFPFPNSFVYEMFKSIMPDIPDRSLFDRGLLTWRIMDLLERCIEMPGFEDLRAYVTNTENHLKQLQISARIADIFDQYLLYRPDMIFRWEEGDEYQWQALLWREIVGKNGNLHRAALGKKFFDIINDAPGKMQGIPERISMFGISSLPPFHLEVMASIARVTNVNLFLINPCREYWGDILSDREIHKKKKRYGHRTLSSDQFYFERGNSLLSSMGMQARDFFDLINEFDCQEVPLFEDSDETTLLSCIRSDLLNLRNPEEGPRGKRMVADQDASICLHSCHSPMREIEILHDNLLDMFERDPELMPRDILVMTPDIEGYAPYIEAVFNRQSGDTTRIPFSIADRTVRRESEIIDTFLKMLDLFDSRCNATEVLAMLELQAVRRRFGFQDEAPETIHRWVRDSGIRWGIDEGSRNQLGLHPFRENTWRAGLDRLLLGYAMPGHNERMCQGILAYDHIEGSETELLGRFIEFAEQVFSYVTRLGRPGTLEQWAKLLGEMVDRFFLADDESEREMRIIRDTLDELTRVQELVHVNEDIDAHAMRWYLKTSLENKVFGFGFMTGGVTFCAMLPMRSIPAKVICLLGMNGDAYPRESSPTGFDLIAKSPRKGDRSRRSDDRYLFLETILSARKKLYISYIGQDVRDNTPIPPSVLVSELVDYIQEGFYSENGEICDQLVTQHRLQAFSPEYFRHETPDTRLFSYSEHYCGAARHLLGERKLRGAFIAGGLSAPDDEWRTISLNDLYRFYRNPARFILNNRLGLYIEEQTSVLKDHEEIELGGLERYQICAELLKRRMKGDDITNAYELFKASGRLPHGAVGECVFEDFRHGVERFVERTRPYMKGECLDPLEVDLDIEGFSLTGRIETIHREHALSYRYGKLRAEDYIPAWIDHLVLNIVGGMHHPDRSIIAGLHPKSKEWVAVELRPVEDARMILIELVTHFWNGLMRPLRFFPRSSWKYAEQLIEKGKTPDEALAQARTQWTGSEFSRGECNDLSYRQCFKDIDPLDDEFRCMSERIFGPVLKHRVEKK